MTWLRPGLENQARPVLLGANTKDRCKGIKLGRRHSYYKTYVGTNRFRVEWEEGVLYRIKQERQDGEDESDRGTK